MNNALHISNLNGGPAARGLRALAQAGLEIFMALIFVILLTIIFSVALPSLLANHQLFEIEVEFTLKFPDEEEQRLDRINEALVQILPRNSRYLARESEIVSADGFAQTVIIEVNYSTPLALLQLGSLPWRVLAEIEGSNRSIGVGWEIVSVRGPPPMLAALWPFLALAAWLLIRLWWMPRSSAPVKPVWPDRADTKRLLLLSAGAGLVLGIVLQLAFIAGGVLGLLEVSDNLPTIDMLGVDYDALTIGAVVAAALLAALVGAVEEVMFRGVILRPFVQNNLPMFGICFCAMLFTIAHFPAFSWHSGNIAYAILLGVGGLGLGILTLRTGTWLHAAALHAVYNFSVIVIIGLFGLFS